MIIQSAPEQQVIQFVVDRYEELKNHRREKEDVWMDCIRAYLSDFDPIWNQAERQYHRSKRFVALSFDAVESLNAQLLSAMFVGDKWLHMDPGTPGRLEHDDTSADEVKALLLHQTEVIAFQRDFSCFLKQLQITGNAPYQVGWRKEYATDYPEYERAMKAWQLDYGNKFQKFQQAMIQWGVQSQQAAQMGQPAPPRPTALLPEPPPASRTLAYSGPAFEVGDIFNFVIDPFSPDQRNALRIKRSFVCKNSLLRLSEKNEYGYSVYDNIDDVQEVDRRGTQADDYQEERFRAFGLQMPSSDQVEILEAWGTMEIPGLYGGDKDAYVAYVATVANSRTLIRFEPTFLWSGDCPVQMATFRDVPGQVYGIGQIEMGLGLQDIINVRANQIIDATAYAINPEHKYVDDGIINPRDPSFPGKMRAVGDINNFQPIPKDFSGVSLGMNEIEGLKREFQTLTKTQSSMSTPRKESATATSLSAGSINTDVAKVAKHIEDNALKKIIELFIQLNAQYKTKPEMVKFLQKGDSAFMAVSPESLRRNWIVKIRGSQHVLDKQERIQNLMMFLQLALGNPIIAPTIKPLEMAKELAEELGIPVERIFRDAEEAEAVFNMMMASGLFGNGGRSSSGDWRSGEVDSRAASGEAGYSGGSGTGQGGQVPTGVLPAGERNPAGEQVQGQQAVVG